MVFELGNIGTNKPNDICRPVLQHFFSLELTKLDNDRIFIHNNQNKTEKTEERANFVAKRGCVCEIEKDTEFILAHYINKICISPFY